MAPQATRAFAPGRVNLIGDHTDYSGGLAMPMAVELGTTVELIRGGGLVRLASAELDGEAVVPLDVADPGRCEPLWARYVGGVVAALRPTAGGEGRVSTTLPVGGGMSSSAALEAALALALDAPPAPPGDLARLCQRAEHLASGVPCGIMDQLTSVAGVAGHALIVDCATTTWTPTPVPDDVEITVIDSGEARTLAGSAYAKRRAEVEAATALIGPLRHAPALDGLEDAVLRRRARHVISENARVLDFAAALARGDYVAAGALMVESHLSLRDDFEVSTPTLDALVVSLCASHGVWGARLTGAGFGGCVVALTEPGALSGRPPGARHWRVHPSGGARLL